MTMPFRVVAKFEFAWITPPQRPVRAFTEADVCGFLRGSGLFTYVWSALYADVPGDEGKLRGILRGD